MSDRLWDIFLQSIKNATDKMKENGASDEEIAKQVKEKTNPALSAMMKEAVKDITHYSKEHMYEYIRYVEAEDAEFFARQEQKWGKCFVASHMMYFMAVESAQEFSEYVGEIDKSTFREKQFRFLALQHLHGRACQEYLEVLTLMRTGFADGAYARWRSMYELCCIADFINNHGEELAKRYYEHSETSGKSYDWAKIVNDNEGKPVKSFAQIQRMCNVAQSWKDQYDLGCLVTHASPQGTFGRMANGCATDVIPVGRSDYGITTPAEHSAISLAWISATYLSLLPHADSIATIHVLNNWIDVIRELYFSTHDIVFRELIEQNQVKKLWDKPNSNTATAKTVET